MSHPYPATSTPITDPETVALWASYEAASERAKEQYEWLPTADPAALVVAAIEAVLDEQDWFTVAELRARLDPRWPSPQTVPTYIGRLAQRGLLEVDGEERQRRFRWALVT